LQLLALKWKVQPVTSYDIVHLLLPFLYCEREHRQQLVQYVENITLAQMLVYPLLRYEPSMLAVVAIVCGASLVSGVFDEELNRGLVRTTTHTSPDPAHACAPTLMLLP
jgi:hypothetical protein